MSRGKPIHPNALTGTTLAEKYRLTRLLGSGGMGDVYQAEQLGLGRSVAIKIVRQDRLTSGFDWFRSEAMAASRINHPHAVAIYDFGVTQHDLPFLVMEHLRGETLATLVDRDAFSIERVVTVGAQVLSALAEAHACAVIHCDLTSHNVIIERLRDGGDFAKVIDFGLARMFGADTDAATYGTPEYMAPEQIRGQTVTPATDLYAVGILLYEMIVGRTPFAAATVPVVLDGHLHAMATALDEIVPGCPRDLGHLVEWALDKSPERRPPDAEIMRTALLSVLGNGHTATTCPMCGEIASWRQRFCASCGVALASDRGAARSPQLALGSRPLARGPMATVRPARSTRLTCELRGAQPVIGREREIGVLLDHCRGTAGNSTLALIGPHGIGKARLLLEARHVLTRQVPIFTAAPDPSGQRTSWYPILSILEAVLGHHGNMTLDTLTQAVARCGLPNRDVPGLAEIFCLSGPAESLELAVRRREAHASAVRALLSVSRRFPRAVLCFADIEEYDQPSRRVVTALSEVIAASGMRLVVTTTAEAEVPPGAALLSLPGLDPETSLRLAIALTGPGAPLPSAADLHTATGGSPAAIEQLAGWVLMGNSSATAPSLLVDLVSMRINRMSRETRRVLQAIAVHGNVVTRSLVEATLGQPTAPPVGADSRSHRSIIDTVIEDRGCTGVVVLDDDEITIPSEIVAGVITACTPADVRRNLHRRALAALSERAPPGVLGHHAEHAGDLERAYRDYLAAGAHAVRYFDDIGAAGWYRRALSVARQLRAQSSLEAIGQVVEASYQLADVLRCTGHSGAASEVLDQADRDHPGHTRTAHIERTRGRIAIAENDLDTGITRFQRAIGLGMRAGDRNFLCETYIDLARVLDRLGHTERAIEELTQAVDVLTMGQGLSQSAGPDKLWYLGLNLAERLLQTRQLTRARAVAIGALEQAKRVGSMRGRGRLSAQLARICDSLGQSAAALRYRSNAIDVMRQLGDRRSTAELLIDNAAVGRRPSEISPGGPVDWRTDPGRGIRMAGKLAAEVGWQEGIALSQHPPVDKG